jgi:2-polyprenyl-6-methoxyphenol hydroxylase-like FAD-dependent oxidoreductase
MTSFRRVGGGLVFHSNGQRVLEALGPLPVFRGLVVPVRTMLIERPDRTRLSTFDYREIPVPHNSAAVLLRADLLAFLLEEAVAAGVQVNGTGAARASIWQRDWRHPASLAAAPSRSTPPWPPTRSIRRSENHCAWRLCSVPPVGPTSAASFS